MGAEHAYNLIISHYKLMKFFNRYQGVAFAVGALSTMLFSSCTDDNYDLDNLDTTMRIEVKDLTLPLNLAPVQFSDLINLTDEECVDTINGQYVLIKSGFFESDQIRIEPIEAEPAEPIHAVDETLPIFGGVAVPISAAEYKFTYTYYGVDKYIVSLQSGKVDFDMTVTIAATDANGASVPCEFSNLVFDVPVGLYGYCKETGEKIDANSTSHEIHFPGKYQCQNGVFTFTYHVDEVDCTKAQANIIIGADDSRTFNYEGTISMKQASVKAISGNGQSGNISVSFEIGSLNVASFTGDVYYELQDLDVDPITLDDLPDVLTQKETRISLTNPQIYLKLNNPLGNYGVEGTSGLKITQQRQPGEAIQTASLASQFKLLGKKGEQNFCLSPIEINDFYAPFPNSAWFGMNNLGHILYGDGLPEGLLIDFEKPQMDTTFVEDFLLDNELGVVKGEYTFYAPLEFNDNSQVIYCDTVTGWGLGGSEELEISELTLKANCASELPVNVVLKAEPVNEDGQVIKTATLSTVSINAGQSKPIELKMTGSIRNIDGMRYTVTLASGQDASALKPTMHLNLTDLKITVSGFYESVDDDDPDEDDTYGYDD